MGEHCLNLIRRIVLQQRVGQNDAAGCPQPGKRGIGLLALFRELPLIDAAHARAGAFTQPHQPLAQLIVFQRIEFIKQREEHHRRNLGEKYHERDEDGPGDKPPNLRIEADGEVKKLDQNGVENQADEESLDFIGNPATQLLIGEVEAVFQAKAVVIERQTEQLGQQRQFEDIEKYGQGITIVV